MVLRVNSMPKRAMIKTGTYTGNGVDDRDIDIGIDLANKSNVYLIIKGEVIDAAVHRIEYGQGDLTMVFVDAIDSPDYIQQFTSTGFQVGSGTPVNQDTVLYRYIAFWEEP